MNAGASVAGNGDVITIEESHIGNLSETRPDVDPRLVRWGYNPGQRNIPNNPRETGVRESFIPVGKFFAHTTFQTPRENCTTDEYKEKEIKHSIIISEI